MTLASGLVEDEVNQTAKSSHGFHGTFYLDTMVERDPAIQAAAVTNKTALKDHFPNSKATGTVTVTSTNVKITYTNVDMEDALASELVSLSRRMPKNHNAYAPANSGIPSTVGGGGIIDTGSGKTPLSSCITHVRINL